VKAGGIRREDLVEPGAAVQDSMTVAAWTAVSRVTGLVRGVTVAAVLGATYFANTYQFTNSLPNLIFYGFLGGSLFTSLLVPGLVTHLDARDFAAAARVAGGLLGAATAATAVLLPIVVLAGPLALRVATAGVTGDPQAAAQARTGALLLILLVPQVALYAVVGTATAVMNAQRRFALAAAAPALENLGTIAVLAGVTLVYGGAPPVTDPSVGLVLVLGLGTTGAVALHAGVQWWGARRTGIVLWPRPGWRDAEVSVLLRRALRSLAQAGLSALLLLGLLVAADRQAGGVVAFQLAMNFFFLPIALAATPVALSLSPRLSRLTGAGDALLFRQVLTRGLRLALFLSVPAAAAFCALATPLAAAVSYGAFAAGAGAGLVAASLTGLGVGVVAETLFLIGTYACYARGDTRTPLRAMQLQVGLGLPMCLLATRLTGQAGLAALGAVLSIATTAGAAALWVRLHRAVPSAPGASAGLAPSLIRTLVAATVMVVPARLAAGAGLLAVVVIGGVTYFAVQWCLGAPELRWVLRRSVTGGEADAVRRPALRRAAPRPTARHPRRPAPSQPATLPVPRPVLPAWGVHPKHPTERRPTDRQPAWPRLARDVVLLIAASGAGALLAASGRAAALVAVVALVAVLVARRPAVAAYLLVVATPLTVGIDRGTLIPGARPNEAVLGLVAGILLVRAVVLARTGQGRWPRPDGVEWSLLAICVFSSVAPLLMMLARGRDITGDDISYAVVVWKLLAVYLVVRCTVTTARQSMVCLVLSLATGAVVSILAILQSLELFGVPQLLAKLYSPFGVDTALSIGRGSSTLSLAAATGDLMILDLAIALALLVQGFGWRRLLAASALLSLFGVFATGQFSTAMALALAVVAFVVVTRHVRLLIYAVPAGLVAMLALAPVIGVRLEGFQSASGIPESWLGRWRNLQTYFWPQVFSDGNWVLGVRPSARVPVISDIFGYVWIESGYTWLLWGGGLPLLAAYVAFVVTSIRRGRACVRAADGAGPSVTAAAGAAVVAAVAAQVLSMLFDPHFTYRGSADALMMVLAIARLHGRVHPPPRPRRPLDDMLRPWAPPTDSSKAAMR
jgi:putative peptidoglycan lipid II flippase